jgi:hypothetical protein
MENTARIMVSEAQKRWLDSEGKRQGYTSGAEYLAKIVEEEQARREWDALDESQKDGMRELLAERSRLAADPDAEWLNGGESRERIREMSRLRRLPSR